MTLNVYRFPRETAEMGTFNEEKRKLQIHCLPPFFFFPQSKTPPVKEQAFALPLAHQERASVLKSVPYA